MSIKENIKNGLFKTRQTVVNHSPEILLLSGIGGIVVSVVLACKASYGLKEKIDEIESKFEPENSTEEENSENETEKTDISKEDKRKETIEKVSLITKTYIPYVAVGVTAINCIVYSHKILRDRNATLLAAYIFTENGFKAYRKKIKEKFGEEEERDIYQNVKHTKVKTDDKKKEDISTVDEEEYSFSKLFDAANSREWSKDPNYNKNFLKIAEQNANKILQTRGYIFLNEVYEMLGMDPVCIGNVVGWTLNGGDGYVDFGLREVYTRTSDDEAMWRFMNGYEATVLLDFNVDGQIIHDVGWFTC